MPNISESEALLKEGHPDPVVRGKIAACVTSFGWLEIEEAA
jgi:hypothetical protein